MLVGCYKDARPASHKTFTDIPDWNSSTQHRQPSLIVVIKIAAITPPATPDCIHPPIASWTCGHCHVEDENPIGRWLHAIPSQPSTHTLLLNPTSMPVVQVNACLKAKQACLKHTSWLHSAPFKPHTGVCGMWSQGHAHF